MVNQSTRIAIVIEPYPPLAEIVAECLEAKGYSVTTTGTHAGAALLAVSHIRVDFLAAAVPAAGEDRDGAYLFRARGNNGDLKVVIMLSDPGEDVGDAPVGAIQLVKPFSRLDLDDAITRAAAWNLAPLRV